MDLLKEPRPKLRQAIFSGSKDQENWLKAKLEWRVSGIQYQPDGNHCSCGQRIKRVVFIKNENTKSELIVGVDCANQFLDFDINEKIFTFLPDLKENNNLPIPGDIITSVFKLGYIFETEIKFLQQIQKREVSSLSEKQRSWREKIVNRLINQLVAEVKIKKYKADFVQEGLEVIERNEVEDCRCLGCVFLRERREGYDCLAEEEGNSFWKEKSQQCLKNKVIFVKE